MVSVESTGGLERRMKVQVPADRIETEVDKRLLEVGRRAKLKGFRPGKVPMKVIRQQYGPQVRQEVLSELVQSSWYEAVSDQQLRPVGGPRIETQSAGQGEDLTFTATFEVFPEIALTGHEGLAVERPVAEIAASDLDDMIERLRRQRGHWHAVERKARRGDRVVADFDGTIDGQAFPGGSGREVSIVLGEARMLKDFEAGLADIAAGEERRLTVNFPPDYGASELAGRTAEFQVTARRVEEEHLPDLDDDFCRSFGIEEGGIEKLRSEVEENMRQEMAERVRELMKRQALDRLLEAHEVDLPAALVEQEILSLQQEAARRMGGRAGEQAELPPREAFEDIARRRVGLGLLIGEVARSVPIHLDAARVRARLEMLAASYPKPAELLKLYTGNRELMAQIETAVIEDQVVDWLLDHADVTEKPMQFKDLMEPAH
jgi:trigger factor